MRATHACPAGLTARAWPEARPEMRAANFLIQGLPPNRLISSSRERLCCMAHAWKIIQNTPFHEHHRRSRACG